MQAGFSDNDLRRIEKQGRSVERIREQLALFQKGPRFIVLDRSCSAGDGVVVLENAEMKLLKDRYEDAVCSEHFYVFVPASGAASRMFRRWHQFMQKKDFDGSEEGDLFARELPGFAFYDDLERVIEREGESLDELLQEKRYSRILRYVLTSEGLNYADLPKALLKFHRYGGVSRTPLEEHLSESARYVRDGSETCRIHFTLSPEHRYDAAAYLASAVPEYKARFGVQYEVSLSEQLPETDTIAVDASNQPFRDARGELVFRPGGHGALLKNLNSLGGDGVFLKNIDNVVPESLQEETARSKKILGGFMVSLRDEIFTFLRVLDGGDGNEAELDRAVSFCREKLFVRFPPDLAARSREHRREYVYDVLNRPLRVCGVVRNEGEPGGGPFWVREEDGRQSLQIVEGAQVDFGSKGQKDIWESSTYFNPVDIVCSVRDHQGRKYDLENYVDREACLISEKSLEGRDLKALELPGLWNGSMSRWNTVFVEVPLITFNPVKTVEDLLRKEHRVS